MEQSSFFFLFFLDFYPGIVQRRFDVILLISYIGTSGALMLQGASHCPFSFFLPGGCGGI